MKINSNLIQISPYKIEITDKNIQRKNTNESEKPILPIEILTKNILEKINFYPDKKYQDMTKLAAKFYKTSEEYTIAVNGSDEGLDLIIRTLCNKSDNIVILSPTFSMYNQYAKAFGINVFQFELNENLQFEIEQFISFCEKIHPKLIIIPNPVSPIGFVIEDVEKIITKISNSFILIDEAYIEFSKIKSSIKFVKKYKNLIVTRTLSKFFGLAGARLGFVFSQHKSDIMKIKSPYSVNQISCQIGINLFQNITKQDVKKRFDENLENKKNMQNWLNNFNEIEKIYESDTNFFFIKLNCNSVFFEKKLEKEHKIKIKSFQDKFEKFCRISF